VKRLVFIFLKTVLIALFLNRCTSVKTVEPKPSNEVFILQGYTSETEAQFSVLHHKAIKPLFFVRGFEDLANFKAKPIEVTRTEMPHSEWMISLVRVFRLSSARSYQLETWTPDKFLKLAENKFQTPSFKNRKARILIVSCMSLDPEYQQEQMWNYALSHNPDFVFLIGDSVYAHRRLSPGQTMTTEALWDAYVEARQKLALYQRNELISTLALWDDGDYGMKDGDLRFPLKRVAKTIFESFNPRLPDDINLAKGPGLARLFTAYGVNFFFLDARSFRSPKGAKDEPETQWGQEQENWVVEKFRTKNGPKVLIQGDQFYGAYHPFDSYQGERPTSFNKMLGELRRLSKTPLLLISGDRHLTEVMKITEPKSLGPVFELTTSALHARAYAGSFKDHPNPNQVIGKDGEMNFAILELNTGSGKTAVTIKSFGSKNQELFRYKIEM